MSRLPAAESLRRAQPRNSPIGLWLIMCSSLVAVACGENECQRGETRCDNGVAKRCLDTEGLSGNVLHWGGDEDCGAADLCVLTKADSTNHLAGDPFCVLDPTPDPSCIEVEHDGLDPWSGANITCAADGVTLLYCRDGYLVGRDACASCAKLASSEEQFVCSGTFDSPCQSDADCRSSLVCDHSGSAGFCSRPCSCDSSASSCEECGDISGFELVGQARTTHVCRAGWCAL